MEYGLDVGSDRLRLAVGVDGSTHEVIGVDRDGTGVDGPLETLLADREPGTIRYAVADGVETRTDVAETLEGLGFEPAAVSRGFAVVYDQLGADGYTGLGVCLGREATSVALAYYGVPVVSFSLPRGGEWIVERAATATDHPGERVRRRLGGFALDPDAGADGLDRALATAYDGLIAAVLEALREEAASAELGRGIAVPVAVGGGFAVDGVEFLLGGRLGEGGLPFPIRGARLAEEPAASAACGALVAATEGVTDGSPSVEGVPTAVGDSRGPTDDAEANGPATVGSEPVAIGGTGDGGDAAAGRPDAEEVALRELEGATAELEAELRGLDGRIGTLEATQEEIAADVAATGERTDGAVERIDGTERGVDALEARLEDVRGRIEGELHDVDDRLGAVEDGLGDVSERIGVLERSRLVAVEDGLAAVEGNLAAIEDDLAAVEDDLAAIEDDPGGTDDVAGPALAGAGGAGLLTGVAFTATGALAVGAGSILLGVACLLGAARSVGRP